MRRVNPLYLLAAVLAIAVVVFAFATVGTAPTSPGRTGSVYDDGPGGAAALRRYLAAMGASTTTVQGDRFVPDPSASVLFILGATEAVTPGLVNLGSTLSGVTAGLRRLVSGRRNAAAADGAVSALISALAAASA